MLKVGITGQAGFIGTHLFNFLGLKPDEFECIPFKDEYFSERSELERFVSSCDVIIHLAAMNRHNDPQVIYETNLRLVNQLIQAMESTASIPHVLFSSSTQENRDNLYGKSKREGRELLAGWAERKGARFTALIIPNVFGPFGHPYYNSVVATFCHQLSHNETPKIEVDGMMKLIYVGELTNEIYKQITVLSDFPVVAQTIPHTSEKKVSEILSIIQDYKEQYQGKGIFPALRNRFEVNLFNTFRCYMDIANHFPVKLVLHADNRGAFAETIKAGSGGQVSYSTTRPGITRGNHFHTRKIERFAVVKGEACIRLRRIGTDEILSFSLSGDEPAYVDMPIWYTHNITNTGDDELLTIFWINEFYDEKDPDTWFEVV